MKRMVSAIVAAAMVAALAGTASAGGRGRVGHVARVGHAGHGGGGVAAFFVGLLGGALLSAALNDHGAEAYRSLPPPADRVWVEGRYETRYERRWEPGHREVDRDRDEYDGDGEVWVPGRYVRVPVKVWVEGHWEERG